MFLIFPIPSYASHAQKWNHPSWGHQNDRIMCRQGADMQLGMRSLSWTFFRIGFFLAVDERNAVAVQSLAWQCTCGLGWLGQFLLPFHPHWIMQLCCPLFAFKFDACILFLMLQSWSFTFSCTCVACQFLCLFIRSCICSFVRWPVGLSAC